MTFDEALRARGVSVPEDVAYACRLLEDMGWQYKKDFLARDAIEWAGAAILELETERGDDE